MPINGSDMKLPEADDTLEQLYENQRAALFRILTALHDLPFEDQHRVMAAVLAFHQLPPMHKIETFDWPIEARK